MKIVIDAYGGDNAPGEIVEGVVLACQKHKDLEIVLCGKENVIKQILKGRNKQIEVVNADEVISCDEVPTEAIRKKKNSSLVVAFDVLKTREDVVALISAGSTGAILAGAVMKIGRLKNVSRPSLAPLLPTKKDGKVLLIDSGANIDCKSEHLCQFALMGAAYFSIISGNKEPRVGLLNIGVEDSKGNALTKEVYPLLKNLPINFIGNVEARNYMSGDVDVVVCDGFAGNVLLKGVEGAVSVVMSHLKKSIKASFSAKIGYLFMKKAFVGLRNKIDIKKHGGSPLLGIKKLVIKNHGSSSRSNILASIEEAMVLHLNKLNDKIEVILGGSENA